VIAGTTESSFVRWLAQNPIGAARACEALVAADRLVSTPKIDPPGSFKQTALVLLPVLIGAALTWLATERRSGRDRDRALADALRKRVTDLRAAGTAFGAEWVAGGIVKPQSHQVDESRNALLGELRRVNASRPTWQLATGLVALIEGCTLDDAIDASWPAEPQPRRARARALDAWLRALEDDVAISRARSRTPRAAALQAR